MFICAAFFIVGIIIAATAGTSVDQGQREIAGSEGGRQSGTWRRRATVVNGSSGRRFRFKEEGVISGRLRRIKAAGRSPGEMAASDGYVG